MKWFSIETAPRDRDVFLWEKWAGPFVGRWERNGWSASTSFYEAHGDAYVVDNVISEYVTHWLPIPESPDA